MTRMHAIILLTVACGLAAPAAGSEDKPPRPKQHTGDASFQAVSDLGYHGGDPSLRGARRANPNKYRASFYSSSAEGQCTSTLIGPRVVLTAAHCVGDGRRIMLSRSGSSWKGTCTHAPGYAADETADWALCALTDAVPGVEYERVTTDPDLVKVGDEIQLTGFGCTQADGTGGNDGTYRIGEVAIRRLPTSDDNDIVTRGNTVVCPGDSGGPAFYYTNAAKGRRTQISVNSRVSVEPDGRFGKVSYLSSLSTPEAKAFLAEWRQKTGLKICGIDQSAGCHP
jgi:trypsin